MSPFTCSDLFRGYSELPGLVRGEAGQVCVEFQPHPVYCGVKPWHFFCHKYLRKQPVFQLPSLPPCQLTLLSCLKLDIVLLWANDTTTVDDS